MKAENCLLSWCAGLFDADGCFCLYWEHSPRSREYPYIKAAATLDIRDEVAVDIFVKIFGGSKRTKIPKNSNHSPTFVWRASGPTLDAFISRIKNYLVLKSPQANVIERARSVRRGKMSTPITSEEQTTLEEYIQMMKKLNATGVGKSWQPADFYFQRVQFRKTVAGENVEG